MSVLTEFDTALKTNRAFRVKFTIIFFVLGLALVAIPAQLRSARDVGPYAGPAVMPPLGPAQKLSDGVLLHKITLFREPEPSHLWVYLPENSGAKLLPCVFIAPAGSRMFHGMTLGDGDMPEHLPYVKAEFAVVAYELDGELKEDPKGKDIIKATLRFQNAQAGVENAKTAIDYALARIPNIDRKRLFTAGHSSAATASLVVAQNEPRIKACIAYAPICDLKTWFEPEAMQLMTEISPDFPTFVNKYSPINATERLQCPTFLFHAMDDTTVEQKDITPFVSKLKQTNNNVTYIQATSGGHYQSMIDQGIPQGIAWLKRM